MCDTATRGVRGIYRGSSYDVYALAFHPVRIEPDRGIRTLRGLATQISRVRFSTDGRYVAALAHNWQVGVWMVPSNRLEHILTVPRGELADNADLRFSPDNRQLAFATSGAACLWNLETRNTIGHWSLPAGICQSLAYAADVRLLLFQTESEPPPGTNRICHLRELVGTDQVRSLLSFAVFNERLFRAEITPDARHLVLCGRSRTDPTNQHTLELRNAATGRVLFATNYLYAWNHDEFGVDPTGRLFGRGACKAGTNDLTQGHTTLWRIADATVLDTVAGAFNSLSPGADWLAIPGPGVRLRPRASGGPDLVLSPDHDTRFSPTFSYDGRFLAWGTAEGLVFVTSPADLLRRLADLGL